MKKLFVLLPMMVLSQVIMAQVQRNAETARRFVQVVLPERVDGVKMVRLEAVSDNIIRVRATGDDEFPEKHSLIVKEVGSGKPEDCTQKTDSQLTAGNVSAKVDGKTGAVTFFDAKGKIVLQESANGKKMMPFRVPEKELGEVVGEVRKMDFLNPESKVRNGWSWHIEFDSDEEEAFYGLGQHQSEELNMKGRNEDLFQYNTKVAVPFVVSSKGYGILWDSYSYCRWGNPEDYMQLGKMFRLFDKDGKEGSLTGTYTDRRGRVFVRQEDSIYFENSETIVNLPREVRLNGGNVVYEGFIEAPKDALYRFILYYAGYTKVSVDGKEVVSERWRTAWNPNAYKFEVEMTGGKRVPLRIEWMPDGDVSYCGLRVAPLRSEEEQGRLSVWSEMSRDLDYYFIYGQQKDDVLKPETAFDRVIAGYRLLTGKASILPKWALGFWQSRERYKTQDEIVSTLKEFRDREIPIDNIVQDWFYWKEDDWGSHNFDTERFPDPQKMMDDIHNMHGRYMISVWPKFYVTTDNYKALDGKGWMYRQAVKDGIRDWVGRGYLGSFYDAYDDGARKMFWNQMNENLYSKYNKSIDAWWMDASEPNVKDCTPMWYRKALCGPTALGTSTEYFNAYSLVNADAIYNGQRSVNPNQRVFLLTRSGFAGEQRYSTATWSGDIGTRWEDMRAQMTAGLNYCMAGLPFWGMDIGGFCVENRYVAAQQLYDNTGQENDDLKEWRELQTRWTQFGCFVPLYRTHGQWPTREVWNIAPENHPAYKSIVYYHRLRYRLMPYIYSIAAWCNLFDYTMMRALPMDFCNDSNVADVKDQWMFGPAIMACPVGEYKARSREVYFPSDGQRNIWYDFYTGRKVNGSGVVNAPYERIPLFVKAGSIIPFGPEMQWSDEKQPEAINLYVYDGADGNFLLYEDEGTNYNYEKGQYATINFQFNNDTKQLTIGKRDGKFPGMLKKRIFNVVFVNESFNQLNADGEINLDNPQGIKVTYNGKEVKVKLVDKQ